ncbi:MAG: ABC transporter permease [Deltaproteobacteria bacterium]|nr:ABC transporter permease [Deltaproteobacteria bacterium]
MNGNNLALMAWRNLWRHRRRTIITISGIAFGLLLAVLFTGISDAGYGNMIDYAARLRGGHVTVQHAEYLDKPSLSRTVSDTRAFTERALVEPGVTRVVTRISGEVMLSTAGKNYGAGFIAYDPASEDAETFGMLKSIGQTPEDGEAFADAKGRGIILGARLAKNLGVGIGKKVVYTMTDKQGEIITGMSRVSGIIRTGGPSVDGGICLFPIDTIREALGYEVDEGTMVSIFLDDHRDARQLAAKLQAQVGDQAAALIWSETQPDLAAFISMKVNGGIFLEMIIAILIAAVIFITLFVSVMERLREFGILLAIGCSPGRLSALVLFESFWLAIVGLGAGILLTIGPYLILAEKGLDLRAMMGVDKVPEISGIAMSPVIPFGIYPENAVIIAILVVVATLLSGIYPAWRAARVVPVDTIKLV